MIRGKVKKRFGESHTPPSPRGMGDYYGSGIRNPICRIREDSVTNPVAPHKLGKAPKSLA